MPFFICHNDYVGFKSSPDEKFLFCMNMLNIYILYEKRAHFRVLFIYGICTYLQYFLTQYNTKLGLKI